MRFTKVNNIVGWIVGLFATTVYVMTMEATGSFWDCGEFISSAYKLEIPHPPGAPLFALMGRFFIILFGDNPHTAARGVNFLSALSSGMSILFLFWTITHFARKLVMKATPTAEPDRQQSFLILAAGVVGAIAYTFCDSFWYSAVEGEVYASSAFFTALVFWAILKWEQNQTNNKAGSDKWIVFIFYMMGLSIGVHLLNLLTIPAIVMVYYFKRYRPTLWGTVLAFIIGCIITGIVQVVVIQYTIKGAGYFDIFFVNSLSLPFFTGFGFYFVLMAALLTWGLLFKNDTVTTSRYRIWLMLFILIVAAPVLFGGAGGGMGKVIKLLVGLGVAWVAGYFIKKEYLPWFRLGLWCFSFMLLGYSTYLTTMIRSNADTPVDMYNVDNPVALEGYLSRDQYGDWPIIYGPDFQDQAPTVDGPELYVRGKDKYEVAGKTMVQDWGNTQSSHVFPRMWSPSNDRHEIDTYRSFSGMGSDDVPTMADNIKYFFRYQVGWMYLRYFMWNYSGKQNDLEGFGNPRDGNAITGIPFIDNAFLGDQSKLPDTIHTGNKSYNRMFLLPLILGLIGLIWQAWRSRPDLIVTGLLFFFTGFAIVIYLNQAGLQPRERDYAFAGSEYAFAIWIGLGVLAVAHYFTRFTKQPAMAHYAAAGLCLLAVPVLMGSQEWDDHDRSKKTLPRDLAKDYLESCPPNAMLFSFGDNDTYPLWYAQEVEGIRPDVRVIVNTLLGTDWYMNELRYKVNQSAPFDVIFPPEQIMGDRRNVVYFSDKIPGFDQNKYYNLYDILKNVVGSDDPRYTTAADNGSTINLVPVHKFSLPVDPTAAAQIGAIHPGDSVLSALHLDVPDQRRYLLKNDLAMLAVIAGSKWKRPICFTSPQDLQSLGLDKYVRLRGMVYQLVPVEGSTVDNDASYKTIMEKFAYGNAGTPGVYYDEENRRHLNSIKFVHAQIAMGLAMAGKKDSARTVLEHYDKNVLESNMPYGMTSNQGNLHDYFSFDFLQACYMAGDSALARKVSASLRKDLTQQMRYYNSFSESPMSDEQLAVNAQMAMQGKGGNLSDIQAKYFANDILSTFRMLMQMNEWEKQNPGKGPNSGPPAP